MKIIANLTYQFYTRNDKKESLEHIRFKCEEIPECIPKAEQEIILADTEQYFEVCQGIRLTGDITEIPYKI